ncbi:Uncharacterised protein [Mycobacterium tuberculosis]|nr:Uncharacterised protein [Mycobacterium tuberculosis]
MEITKGKCRLSFDVAAPIPDHQEHQFGGHDHVYTVQAAEQKRHRQRRVDLAAGGQEDHLVAQAQHTEKQQDQHDLPGGQQPDGGAQLRYGAGAIGEQRRQQHHHQQCVEGNVHRLALGAAGPRHSIRPRRQPDGAEPHPVQDRAHRREESVVQRPKAAAQPYHLEQHGVEHDLLEHDRLGVPRCRIGESINPLGGQHDQPADKDVQQDLGDVKQVQQHRSAKTHLGPMLGHRPDLLAAGALAPFGQVDVGKSGLEKSHGP